MTEYSPDKTGENPRILTNFQNCARSEKDLKNNKRARWSYLARCVLPAVSCKKNFPESHKINPLLTKRVRSRWMNIVLVHFCEFMDLDYVLVHKHAKNEFGQYPAILTEQAWSITHIYYIDTSILLENTPHVISIRPIRGILGASSPVRIWMFSLISSFS